MRYVVLDPGSTDPTYGLVSEAVVVESEDGGRDVAALVREGHYNELDWLLATDYELDRRDD